MLRHEAERLDVLLGEAGQRQDGLRQVDALVGGEVGAVRAGVVDGQFHLGVLTVGPLVDGAPGDRPVVEKHALTDLDGAHRLGQGAADARGSARLRVGRGLLVGEDEGVSDVEAQLLLGGGHPGDAGLGVVALQQRGVGDVGVLLALGEHAAVLEAGDGELALGVAVVPQVDDVALGEALEPRAVDAQRQRGAAGQVGGHRRVLALGKIVGGEPDLRRGEHEAGLDAGDAGAAHLGAGGDLPGAHLRAGEVHGDLDLPAGLAGGGVDVVDHALPHVRAVVGAVDAGQLHAGVDEPTDQVEVVPGLGGQGDHDAGVRLVGGVAEEVGGVVLEDVVRQGEGVADLDVGVLQRLAVVGGEHVAGRLEAGQDGGLGRRQAGGADGRQAALHRADVVLAQLRVVDEVDRAVPVVLGDAGNGLRRPRLLRPDGVDESVDLGDQFLQPGFHGCPSVRAGHNVWYPHIVPASGRFGISSHSAGKNSSLMARRVTAEWAKSSCSCSLSWSSTARAMPARLMMAGVPM